MENEEKRKCFIVDGDVRASRCEDRKRNIGKEDCAGCEFIDAAPSEGYEPAAPTKKAGDDRVPAPACKDCGRDDVGLVSGKCYKCRAPKNAPAEPAAATPEPELEKGDDVEVIEQEEAAPAEPLAKGPQDRVRAGGLRDDKRGMYGA